MRFETLSQTITTPFFYTYQLSRDFPKENNVALRFQISRFTKRGLLIRLKRGLYLFPDRTVDELSLAAIIYKPSYLSLETALHLHGIIPDIPAVYTSVTPITPNTFTTSKGVFSYSRLQKQLFFGFTLINEPNGLTYNLAEPEKALLDWLYLRKISSLNSHRVDIGQINQAKLTQLAKLYPSWVKKAVL